MSRVLERRKCRDAATWLPVGCFLATGSMLNVSSCENDIFAKKDSLSRLKKLEKTVFYFEK